ncbi:glutaredoxin family protein [Demequina sp. NBRC 110052]|uniref:glutaredoxin family protein n=1 Tax=Demequina sp. NBRC 110052 TaxID=1570341 RepID=UPI000A0665E9|nr:glutaredoxin family protein [Demequina sp. NBRC 110052]
MSDRVVMYSRVGCHLCAEARGVVQEVCGRQGVSFTEVDVDADAELKERYGDEVPVVTVDGAVVGFWRIDPTVLAHALES